MRELIRINNILRLSRAHGSTGELTLMADLRDVLAPYGVQTIADPLTKTEWALMTTIPTKDGELYPMLWCSHIDTVHGMNDPMHTKLRFNHKTNVIKSSGTTVLGADDGAGVWLMLCMIASGVPGTYMFHRGEECGGIGSRGIAREYGSMLAEYKYAVAFDRKGTTDVITHQAMGRCCSDKFAQALCDLLDMGHMPDPTGIFTDTANYVNEIPECSNISIGYEGAHSYSESLDLTYLYALAERMIEVFADAPELPVVRDPFETDVYDYPAKYSVWDDLYSMDEEDVVNAPFSRLREMVRKDPDGATDLLITLSEKLVYTTEDDATNDQYSNAYLKCGLY